METPNNVEVPSSWSRCELILPNPKATGPIARFFSVNHGLEELTEGNKVTLTRSAEQDSEKEHPGVNFATDLGQLEQQGVEVLFY